MSLFSCWICRVLLCLSWILAVSDAFSTHAPSRRVNSQCRNILCRPPNASGRKFKRFYPAETVENVAVQSMGTPSKRDEWSTSSHRVTESALFSTTGSSESPETPEKKNVLVRLLAILFTPFRILILKPIRLLIKVLSRSKTDDIGINEAAAYTTPGGDLPTNTENIEVADMKQLGGQSENEVLELPTSTGSIEVADKTSEKQKDVTQKRALKGVPKGKRWATAAPGVDLSGNWELIVNDAFKEEYDLYLADLGQPYLVRSVAVGIIGLTTEETKQMEDGKSLLIRGQNVRGIWDRTLVASGAEVGIDDFKPLRIPVVSSSVNTLHLFLAAAHISKIQMTADSEQVEAESWWEEKGRVHVSWLRGVRKYGGGSFESRRYLDGDEYVCESTFHPDNAEQLPNKICWRFRRQKKPDSA